MKLSRKDLEALCKKTGQQLPEADLKVARGESKHGNKFTVVDGITFASEWEAEHYRNLKLLQRVGKIQSLAVHQSFSLDIDNVHIGRYVADFAFLENGVLTIHDTKGIDKGCSYDLFKLKKALMFALRGIDVQEIRKNKR